MSGEGPLDRAPAELVSEPEPEPEPEAAPAQSPGSASPRRSPFARVLVLACALGVAVVVLPRLPREREVDFRIEDTAGIVGIELAWSHEDGDGEAVQGGSWHFEPGHAPRTLTTSVHLPNGRYAVDIVVQRTDGRDELHRVIELTTTDHVTVPLR